METILRNKVKKTLKNLFIFRVGIFHTNLVHWNNTKILLLEQSTIRMKKMKEAAFIMLNKRDINEPSVEMDMTLYDILANEDIKGNFNIR